MALSKFFKFRRKGRLERKGPASTKRRANKPPTQQIKRPLIYRILAPLIILIVWIIGDFAILYRTQQSPQKYYPGIESPSSEVARTEFAYTDEVETRANRKREESKVLEFYRLDSAAREQSEQDVRKLFNTALTKPAPGADPSEIPNDIRVLTEHLTDEARETLHALFDSEANRSTFLQDLSNILVQGIVPEDRKWLIESGKDIHIVDEQERRRTTVGGDLHTPETAAEELVAALIERHRIQVDPALAKVISTRIVAKLIYPNLTYDEPLYKAAIAKALSNVPDVKRMVRKGTIFIEKGQLISPQDVIKKKAHDEAVRQSADIRQEIRKDISLLLLSLTLMIVGSLLLANRHPQIVAKPRNMILIGLVVAVNILLMWAVEEIVLFVPGDSLVLLLYPALPLTLGAMLLALLLGRDVGLTASFFIPAICALITSDELMSGPSLHVFYLGVVTSIIGVLAIYKSRTRVRTFRAALWITLGVALIESIYLLRQAAPGHLYAYMFLTAIVAAFLTVLLLNLLLPLCEWLFRLTTNISLLELSDLNHPLLKRLQLEAPGSYHHTLMVATLAEHAAEAVGANTLLTRVAAYFHDIGKLANPTYFTENSFGQNRHEELSPRMSCMIILNHVKEGLEMAAKYKLKEPIREAIATHHGTSLVYFFYRRALDNGEIQNASDEECFRYPGPCPQSREATIISIADACEAASRSLEKPTPQKIDALVNELFHNKLLTGQLADSELSMGELTIVVETIKKTLQTMLHGRVSYPKFATTDIVESTQKVAPRRPSPAEQPAAAGDTPGPTASPELDPEIADPPLPGHTPDDKPVE